MAGCIYGILLRTSSWRSWTEPLVVGQGIYSVMIMVKKSQGCVSFWNADIHIDNLRWLCNVVVSIMAHRRNYSGLIGWTPIRISEDKPRNLSDVWPLCIHVTLFSSLEKIFDKCNGVPARRLWKILYLNDVFMYRSPEASIMESNWTNRD